MVSIWKRKQIIRFTEYKFEVSILILQIEDQIRITYDNLNALHLTRCNVL